MNKTISISLLGIALSLVSYQAAAEGNLQRGAEKVKAVCSACHGINGVSQSPDFPILAGQHEDYIQEALHAYQRGDRTNPIMKAQAATLSNQDIEDVATYYSKQSAALKTGKE